MIALAAAAAILGSRGSCTLLEVERFCAVVVEQLSNVLIYQAGNVPHPFRTSAEGQHLPTRPPTANFHALRVGALDPFRTTPLHAL